MIHLALRDLRHDRAGFAFSALGIGILVFAFLLLIPLSRALTRLGESEGQPQNLIVVETGTLQPEQSRIPPGLAQDVSAILGERLDRVDAVIFRILRVEGHPIQVRGVDPQAWTTTFGLRLIQGSWPEQDSEVVLGRLAARDGGWQSGSVIEVYGRPFHVTGIVEGAGSEAQTVWLSETAARGLFGADKKAQFLVAHLKPATDPLSARQDLQAGLQAAGGDDEVYFEDALLREYGAALNDLRSLSFVTVLVATVAITLGAHNLAWLAAEERKRLLGVLRTVGFERKAVSRFLLVRACLITAAAYGLALLAAIAFVHLGVGTSHLAIAGAEAELNLDPTMAILGLLLACLASLAGTGISARAVLRVPPASLLGRGPGGTST
ncbi:MAG TPA: ABC transporter permease [Anaerolineales bacterium]|nr:ABC transporter permease [Anaerolineales bacterium]